MRENRPYGSEGGEGHNLSRPLSGVKQGTFTIHEIGDGPRKVYGTD